MDANDKSKLDKMSRIDDGVASINPNIKADLGALDLNNKQE